MTEIVKINAVTEKSGLYSNNTFCLHLTGLPNETTEEDIFLLCKDYFVKSVKIVNKNSKTFSQVIFETVENAEKARYDLNGLNMIPRASQLGIIKPISISVMDNSNIKENIKKDLDRNLLVKNLNKNISGREFFLMMREFGDIKLCKLNVDYYGNSKGYGYVYYYDSVSAEKAIKSLQDKEIHGINLIVCQLIPGKTRDNFKNNIYVKNIPQNYNDDDLKKMFEKFGEIKSVLVSKDIEGKSKGFGFVCFSNPGNANQAYREMKEQNIQFPGLDPLYLNYAQKKDDRIEMLMKDSVKLEQLTVFARLRDDMYLIKTKENFEKEIKNLLKLLLSEEYSPKDIKITMETKTALITMLSRNDVELLMSKYVDYCNYVLPRIFLNYYQNKNERTLTNSFINQLNSVTNPINMFNNFQNLSLVDPNIKPIIHVDPNSYYPANKSYQKKNYNYNNNYNYKSRYNKNFSNNYNNYGKNKNYYKNNSYYERKDYNGGFVKQESESVNLSLNQSVSAPIHDIETKDELASIIYDSVVRKYPENAGKITGMIIDLGLDEMKKLIEKQDQLMKIVEEANELLNRT